LHAALAVLSCALLGGLTCAILLPGTRRHAAVAEAR